MRVCNWMPCLNMAPSKALRKQTERDLPSKILGILSLYVNKCWEVSYTKKSNIPNTASGIGKGGSCLAWYPAKAVEYLFPVVCSCHGFGQWGYRCGQAGFMWYWVTPISSMVEGRKPSSFPHNCLPGLPFSILLFSFSNGRSSPETWVLRSWTVEFYFQKSLDPGLCNPRMQAQRWLAIHK